MKSFLTHALIVIGLHVGAYFLVEATMDFCRGERECIPDWITEKGI